MTSTRRWRYGFTPAGAGVFMLFLPGLLIAASSRHRMLLAISVAAFLAVVTDVVAGRILLGRFDDAVANGPMTATVGEPVAVDLTIRARARRRVRGVARGRDGVGDERRSGRLSTALSLEPGDHQWRAVTLPAAGTTLLTPDRRGVLREVAVRLRTCGPLGLVDCTHLLPAPISSPIWVGPPAIRTPLPTEAVGMFALDRSVEGEHGGIRSYVAGDRIRDVHWPSVARTGDLLVRDRRPEARPLDVAVVVTLSDPSDADPGDADRTDVALGRARSVIGQVLDSGRSVRVDVACADPAVGLTADGGRRIASRTDLVRFLAAAGHDDCHHREDNTTSRTSAVGPARKIRLIVDERGARC